MRHLSPRQLGRALGVSESSVKRWADDGSIRTHRTSGGHRRIEVSEAARFIRDAGLPVLDPTVLGLTGLDTGQDEVAQREVLRRALMQGRLDQVRAVVLGAYLRGDCLTALCDAVVTGAMHEIGCLWQHAADGIGIEHQATDLCVMALNELRTLLPPTSPDAPLAVGGAPEGDPYLLPSLMAACVLAAAGWRTTNFGPDTPLGVFEQAAATSDARLVWLSFSTRQPAARIKGAFAHMAERLARRDLNIVVGGRERPRGVGRDAPNVHQVASMAELVAFAGGMRAANSASRGLAAPSDRQPDRSTGGVERAEGNGHG